MDLLHQPPHWISRLPDGQRVPVRFPVRQEAAQDRRGGTRPYGVWVRLPAAHARPRREGGLVRLRPHRGAVRPRRVYARRLPHPRTDGGRADPRPERVQRPELRSRDRLHRSRRPRAQLEHAAGRAVYAKDAGLRRVELGSRAGSRRAWHDAGAHGLGTSRGAHGSAAHAGWRVPAGRLRDVLMTRLTLGMDYWSLAWPRFLQGFSMGFTFVPLQTLTLATIRLERLGNATA